MRLFCGDNLDHLQFEEDNSIDAVVTDPPYGLSFMGKKWDYDVPSVELWREVLRVMKPGAHVLSFGGTRTYHRMVVNMEDAGFEIRDQVQWIYGSGFPKSLDVSKAIDKAAGAEREVIGTKAIAYPDSDCWGKPNSNSQHGKIFGNATQFGNGETVITAPATPDAKRWQGWGTALKPANEPIVLARKPLERGLTVAENVLKWGTGAINVDAARIANQNGEIPKGSGNANKNSIYSQVANSKGNGGNESHQGRWPANVLFDEDAAAMLDEQSGQQSARGGMPKDKSDKPGQIVFAATGGEKVVRNDSGGASRFFYVAKASKRERNAGLEGMPEKKSDYRPGDEDGRNTIRERLHNSVGKVNHHPTVKPIKLMEYLIKLITPPGGVVLDPFMGSGSTGVATKNLGFKFIGIERDEDYFKIAKKRIRSL